MTRRSVLGLLVVWLALAGTALAGAPSEAPERLDRFRQLATSWLGALELSGRDPAPEVSRELYALLDDEIVDSLSSGGVFASDGFLQEQLDAFNEAWGGTAFTVLTLRPSGLVVGAFQLSPGGWGSSVRVYGPSGPRAGLVRAIQRDGIPVLHAMPPTRAGDPQFLVAWVGPPSSGGKTGLRVELWRRQGESVTPVWSTDAAGEGELLVSRFALGADGVSFRYEVRYPGWKPGCDGQTEHEDRYRYVAARETFVLARRQAVNGWHREFQRDLARFLSALNARDEEALAGLVSGRALRGTLPARLEADLACDEAQGPSPTVVSASAVSPAGIRPGEGGGRPWTLVFRLTAKGWRLVSAAAVDAVSVTIAK